MGLGIKRKVGEAIIIGDDIEIKVLECNKNKFILRVSDINCQTIREKKDNDRFVLKEEIVISVGRPGRNKMRALSFLISAPRNIKILRKEKLNANQERIVKESYFKKH